SGERHSFANAIQQCGPRIDLQFVVFAIDAQGNRHGALDGRIIHVLLKCTLVCDDLCGRVCSKDSGSQRAGQKELATVRLCRCGETIVIFHCGRPHSEPFYDGELLGQSSSEVIEKSSAMHPILSWGLKSRSRHSADRLSG